MRLLFHPNLELKTSTSLSFKCWFPQFWNRINNSCKISLWWPQLSRIRAYN